MATPTALLSSMEQAIKLFESLTTLLVSERTALKGRDTLRLQSLLTDKANLLKTLESNATGRSQLLIDYGVEANDTGVTSYLSSLPHEVSSKLHEKWDIVKSQLNSCQIANQVNGAILHRSKTQIDTLLNIFRGQSGNHKIYTSSGIASTIASAHSLAKV